MHRYRAYGLHIAATTTIAGLPADHTATNPIDLTILEGPPVADLAEDGEPLAEMNAPPSADYIFLRRRDGSFLLRYRNVCDFAVDAQLRTATVHLADRSADAPYPDAPRRALADLLLVGAVPSFVLSVRGESVLHASAVEIGGRALAFVGYSGMGKSTMATLMCADGARLVTDDVLRLDLTEEAVQCHLGVADLRLRKSAGDLVARFDTPPPQQRSSDARDVLRPVRSERDRLPLAAILLPFPRRDIDAILLRRLSAMDAVLALVRYPRLLGWRDAEILAAQFDQLTAIAQRVPCFTVDVPWGPPFAPDLALVLREQLAEALAR